MPSDRVIIDYGGIRGPAGPAGTGGGGGGTGTVVSIIGGTNVTVDSTDPAHPVVSASLSGGGTANVAGDTHAATSKATPVDADELPLVDSAAAFALKKLTWANLKATLGTFFDGRGVAKLSTTRNISGVPFDGTADITLRLDQISTPTADVSLATHKLTNVVNPTSAQDAATKAYVDSLFANQPPEVVWDGTGTQPARPVTAAGKFVRYNSPVQPLTSGGTVGGGGNAVAGLDQWFKTV